MTVETEDNWDQPNQEAQKRIVNAGVEFAKLHTIFTNDARGRKLLEAWRDTARTRVPVGATLDHYARAEAFRTFVDTIDQQIKIASQTK